MAIEQFVLSHEPALRLSVFVAMFALVALWELAAPRRALTVSKALRWGSNLGLAMLNAVLLRLIFPLAAVGVAAFCAANGWGLLNHFEPPFWLAVPLAFVTFSGLPDRGYALAKSLALLVVTWLVWMAGAARLLPFTQLTVALGFAIATQIQQNQEGGLATLRQDELVRVLDDVTQRSSRLDAQVRELEVQRNALQSGADRAKAATEQAQERLDSLAILAGTVKATGPGIRVTIADSSGAVRASALLDVLQELRDAGAEVVQFGTVRIVAGSYFTDAGTSITADGQSLSRPYVILAIGDPALTARLVETAEAAADHARVHRSHVKSQWCGPQRLARGTPAPPSAFLSVAHSAMIGRNHSNSFMKGLATMATEGFLGYYVETRDYNATAAFWKSLGFENVFETDHESGQPTPTGPRHREIEVGAGGCHPPTHDRSARDHQDGLLGMGQTGQHGEGHEAPSPTHQDQRDPERERERIEHERLRLQAVSLRGQIVDAMGHA